MLTEVWDQYRGWAKRAREWQVESRRWNTAVFLCTIIAAILGAASTQVDSTWVLGHVVAFSSAMAVGLTPILGNQILQLKVESKWIRARAVAEAIKSQCFRYAARAGDYAGDNRDQLLLQRSEAATEPLLTDGLTPLDDSAAADARRPPDMVKPEWYRENRLRQQRQFYVAGQRKGEQAAKRLRWILLATSLAGVILGALGGVINPAPFAPWIAVLTTFGATVVAYGFMQRHEYLAGSYGAMAYRLANLDADKTASVADLVNATETLLEAEHGSWLVFLTKTIVVPKAQ